MKTPKTVNPIKTDLLKPAKKVWQTPTIEILDSYIENKNKPNLAEGTEMPTGGGLFIKGTQSTGDATTFAVSKYSAH